MRVLLFLCAYLHGLEECYNVRAYICTVRAAVPSSQIRGARLVQGGEPAVDLVLGVLQLVRSLRRRCCRVPACCSGECLQLLLEVQHAGGGTLHGTSVRVTALRRRRLRGVAVCVRGHVVQVARESCCGCGVVGARSAQPNGSVLAVLAHGATVCLVV